MRIKVFNQRHVVVVRAFPWQLVDLGFIFQIESYQKTLKIFTAYLLGTQKNWNSVENKPASLLVFLGKTLNRGPQIYVADR